MNRNSRCVLRLFAGVITVTAVVLLTSCRPADDETDGGAGANGSPAQSSEAVAKIGDHAITKDELKQRLAQEIRPQRDGYGLAKAPATAESVLRKMVAEKAMALEGRVTKCCIEV